MMDCPFCNASLSQKNTDFYLKVMLCKSCATRANRIKGKLKSEVEALLTRMDEVLRYGLMNQELPGGIGADQPRYDLLRYLVDMDERCRATQSSEPSKPLVTTADGGRSSGTPSQP